MKIKDIDFGQALCLAPMAGVSDVGFRGLCAIFGADATWSEMLSCRAMLHNANKTELMTILSPQERIKIGQIFGHEPTVMADSLHLPFLQKYDVIDINMGCPAPKIVKNGEGSALMKDVALASKIIEACVKTSTKPISVKFRLGYHSDISTEFGRMCEESGADFITLHARTQEMGYSGRADYEAIARLKAAVHIPVIGNGDVVDSQSYARMLATGVDGVMIGRGAQGKPWIFKQLKEDLSSLNADCFHKQTQLHKTLATQDSIQNEREGFEKFMLGGFAEDKDNSIAVDKFAVIAEHVRVLRSYYSEQWLTLYMRKHLLWYTQDLVGSASLRAKIATSNSIDESLKILKEAFK